MSQKEVFSIDNKKVILYGAASIGKRVCDVYEKAGLSIECFIDNRSSEIPVFKGYNVYSITDPTLTDKTGDDYYVFISVKNVFEHTNIANKLIEIGFKNIIYMPISVINGHGNTEQKRLYNAYSSISLGHFEEVGELPKSLKKDMFFLSNESIIAEDDQWVTAFISIEQLYTDRKTRKTPWFSRPVLCLLPHIDLFRYISGDNRYSYRRYLDFCIESAINSDIIITDAWKDNIIKNRSMVYEHMSHSMELESDFFVRNAPMVTYDRENGVFNLNSGKHRAAFFVSIGRKYIPVKVDRTDYELYINSEKVNKLIELLYNRGIDELAAPIPHPFFFNYPCETKEFYYGFIYWLMYHIADDIYSKYSDLDFSRLNIFCAMDDYGFVERVLIRAGANVNIVCNEDVELKNAIDEVLTFDKQHVCYSKLESDKAGVLESGTEISEYDYILVDAMKYPQLLNGIMDEKSTASNIYVFSKNEIKNAKIVFESTAGGEITKVFSF